MEDIPFTKTQIKIPCIEIYETPTFKSDKIKDEKTLINIFNSFVATKEKKKKYASCSLSIIKDDIETTLLITNGFIKNWINNNNKFLCKLRIYVKLNNLYTVNHVLSPKFKFFHEIDLREVTGEIEKEITYWTRSIKANIRDTWEIYELCKADITSINIKHKDELIDGKPIIKYFFYIRISQI